MRKTVSILSILVTSLISYGASAQPMGAPPAAAAPEGAPPAAPAPEAAAPEAVAPAPVAAPVAAPAGDASGLTLSAGAFQVTLPVVLNLSKESVLKPVWIPLDLRYGVTNELTVFLGHTTMGMSPAFMGGGVCLGGEDRGCPKFYNGLAVGGLYSLLKNNGLELAGLLAADFRSLDPMQIAVDVGVAVRYVSAPLTVTVTPIFGIGLNKRSGSATLNPDGSATVIPGNKEKISVPVQIAFQATPELSVFVDSGIIGDTKAFGDNYRIPVGVGAAFAVQPGLSVGAEFMFPSLTNTDPLDATDLRTLSLFASYRTK